MAMHLEDETFDKSIAEDTSGKLRILAEGDSWMAYPRDGLRGGNLIDYLDQVDRYHIRNLAENADELLSMISGKQNHKILKLLKKYKRKNKPFDVFFISGGGNDIVGKYDWEWLIKDQNQWEASINSGADPDAPETYIHMDRLQNKINLIEAGYKHIIAQVSAESPGIRIIGHLYDKPFPSMKGFSFLFIRPESWMMPIMTLEKYGKNIDENNENLLRSIILKIMGVFSEMLLGLETLYSTNDNVHFKVARTFGVFERETNGDTEQEKSFWRNEIHPTGKGFKLIVEKAIIPLIDE